jgi:hypothetical protein
MDREKSGKRAIMFAYDRRWDTGIAFMCVWYEWRCSWSYGSLHSWVYMYRDMLVRLL